MAEKERSQNPVIGDDLILRLFTYNSNHRQDVASVESVKIYYLDPAEVTEENPEGRRLVQTIEGADVTQVEEGQYSVSITLEDEQYVIGRHIDIWEVAFRSDQPVGSIEQKFMVVPDLWYTGDMPIVYGFQFQFRPNRVRRGERRWIVVEIRPNTPTATDLERYYANLSVASPLRISIEQACGDCVPKEQDLRLIVDSELVTLRNGTEGHYFLDTDALELNCGIYNVWFEMEFGESKYISDNQQLQIF